MVSVTYDTTVPYERSDFFIFYLPTGSFEPKYIFSYVRLENTVT